MDELIERIWQELDLIRIYTKPKGKVPDYTEPVILPRRKSTIIVTRSKEAVEEELLV